MDQDQSNQVIDNDQSSQVIDNDQIKVIDQANNETDQVNNNSKLKKIRKKPETVICDKCGFSYKKNNKSHHMQTKKHSEAISVNKLKNDLKTLVDRF